MKTKLVNKDIRHNYGAELLRERGIEDVNEFLNPSPSNLQSWSFIDNISAGMELVNKIKPTSKVAMLVDCDCDGFTSAAILYQYIRRLKAPFIDYFLHEGKQHGLEDSWEKIADGNYDFVLITDASSNDGEYIEKISCPVLVIDHHICEKESLPDNMILINNQLSPLYKNKALSGAGMTYQFCRALDYYFNVNYADDYIDLAALGVCGDAMTGLEIENQYLWKKGFADIKNYFFLSVARKQGYSITGNNSPDDFDIINALNPMTVAFYIVPLINATIRVGTMEEKHRMFTAFIDGHRQIECKKRGCKGQTEEAAIEVARECGNCRTKQNKIKENAVNMVNDQILKFDLLSNQILFVILDHSDELPSELTGLIAMQLSNIYHKPTMLGYECPDGNIKGSIRGLSNCALTSFKDFLDSTGLFNFVQGR